MCSSSLKSNRRSNWDGIFDWTNQLRCVKISSIFHLGNIHFHYACHVSSLIPSIASAKYRHILSSHLGINRIASWLARYAYPFYLSSFSWKSPRIKLIVLSIMFTDCDLKMATKELYYYSPFISITQAEMCQPAETALILLLRQQPPFVSLVERVR